MASKSLTFDIFGRDRTASKAIHGVGTAGGGLIKVFGGVAAAIAGAFAVTRIVSFGKAMVTEFAAAADSQFRLNDSFNRFPALADTSYESLKRLNEELQRKTQFDDDALASGEAILAQYGLTGTQLEGLAPLVADYAAKTKTDYATAAEQVGKALLGQGRALKAVGIDFVDLGSVTENYDQIVAGLRTQVGGFAESEGLKFTGRLEILKNGVGELKERIGGVLAPSIGLLSGIIYDKALPALDSLIDRFGPQVQAGLEKLAGFAGEFLTALSESATAGNLDPLSQFLAGIADAAPIFAVLQAGAGVLGPILPELAAGFQEIGATLQQEGVLESLSELVHELLPPLVEILVQAAPIIGTFADILSAGIDVGPIGWALEAVAGNIGMVSTAIALLKGDLDPAGFARAVEGLPMIGDGFKFLGDTIVSVTNGIRGGLNGFIDVLEGAINGVRFLMGMGTLKLPRFATVSAAAWRVPAMAQASASDARYRPFAAASGAVVRATPGGSLGYVGEGPDDEAVLPLNRSTYGQIGAGIARAGGAAAAPPATVVFEVSAQASEFWRLFDIAERRADGTRVIVTKMGKQA